MDVLLCMRGFEFLCEELRGDGGSIKVSERETVKHHRRYYVSPIDRVRRRRDVGEKGRQCSTRRIYLGVFRGLGESDGEIITGRPVGRGHLEYLPSRGKPGVDGSHDHRRARHLVGSDCSENDMDGAMGTPWQGGSAGPLGPGGGSLALKRQELTRREVRVSFP